MENGRFDRDEQIANSLFKKVSAKGRALLGDRWSPRDHEYDGDLSYACKQLVAQCDLAERQAPDSAEVALMSSLLKAQILGCQLVHINQAIDWYERAIALGADEGRLRYRIAVLQQWQMAHDRAITSFSRVIELAGTDSQLGMECQQEIVKEHEKLKAKGRCFVATAACSGVDAWEVQVLRRFRDSFILGNSLGECFVKLYYQYSPGLAAKIERERVFQLLTRFLCVRPLAWVCSLILLFDSKTGGPPKADKP